MLRPSPIPLFRRASAASMLLLLFLLMQPRQASAWQARHDVKRQIEQLENQWRTAQLGGDIATMDRMLSDDFVGITLSGQVNTKAQQMNRLRSHVLVLTRMDLEDMKVKLAGQVAIVTVKAKVEGTYELKRMDGEFRYTRIYHQLPGGAWKITNFEATRIHRRHDHDLTASDHGHNG